MTDQEGVQAANTTETRRRSVTELARIAATGRGWRFAWDGALLDELGDEIAASIEDAARAMVSLGWLRATSTTFVHWDAVMQATDSAAAAIRGELARNAKPDRIPPGGGRELAALLDLTEAELAALRSI